MEVCETNSFGPECRPVAGPCNTVINIRMSWTSSGSWEADKLQIMKNQSTQWNEYLSRLGFKFLRFEYFEQIFLNLAMLFGKNEAVFLLSKL